MRTIKFRGKQIDSGVWEYGYFLPDMLEKTHSKMVIWGFIREYDYEKVKTVMHEVNRGTVGQFIGLRDKSVSCQEIYEDDICKVTQGCGEVEIGVVVWDEQSLCWALDIGCELWHFSEIIDCGHLVEVIGNIYDHLHLLEQQTPEVHRHQCVPD